MYKWLELFNPCLFSSVETERNKFANNVFLLALFDLIDSEAFNAYRLNQSMDYGFLTTLSV